MNEVELLHIYAQHSHHDEAVIIGDRSSLGYLRDAINEALETGHGDTSGFVNDGEGFTCHVINNDLSEDKVDLLAVPYTDEFSSESRSDAIHPFTVLRERLAR